VLPRASTPLAGLPRLADVIKNAGLVPDKRLGQHFLLDPAILGRIAAAPGKLDGRPVLEIGPGPGGLSRALLDRGARLWAIERDRRCTAALAPLVEAAAGRLVLIEADALDVDIAELAREHAVDQPWAIVANLPYNIGTELVLRWLHRLDCVASLHVMLQKEVALRLAAEPGSGDYGRLALVAQSLCRVRRCFDIPAGAFQPPPRVTSSLVELIPLPATGRPSGDRLRAIEQIGRVAFGQRRKMLRASLKGLVPDPEPLLAAAGIAADRRPETLGLAEFDRLAAAWQTLRKAGGGTA
jgi:16S rRNA (adenine1518-N6/adenine1519-N6)-dimethyltransferase